MIISCFAHNYLIVRREDERSALREENEDDRSVLGPLSLFTCHGLGNVIYVVRITIIDVSSEVQYTDWKPKKILHSSISGIYCFMLPIPPTPASRQLHFLDGRLRHSFSLRMKEDRRQLMQTSSIIEQ